MTTSSEQFASWLSAPEGRHLEFKAASHNYDADKLARYCVALANAGGGQIILGVTDKRPRTVTGTTVEIVSPGGFPPGITVENIVDQQNPRNRRLAEALAKAGLVERSGQGMNLMIENAIKQTKPLPNFSGSAAHEVRLTLAGTVQNPSFIRYLERLGDERLARFSTHDFMTLHALHQEQPLSPAQLDRMNGLIECGAVERIGRGKGIRFLLSQELYEALGEPGTYTRKKGLDRETNKALLLKHIRDNNAVGSPIAHLRQVLPAKSDREIRWLLERLKDEGEIKVQGGTKRALYHLAEPHPQRENHGEKRENNGRKMENKQPSSPPGTLTDPCFTSLPAPSRD